MKKILTLFLILLPFVFATPAYAAVTVNQVVDQYPDVPTVNNSADLVNRIRLFISQFNQSNTHRGYPGTIVAEDLNRTLWFKGLEVSSLAQTLPFLDTANRNSLKTFLQNEVTTYLLNDTYQNYESQGTLSAKIPNAVSLPWDHRNPGNGPSAENLYGLWAYAQYTGDWTTIQNNWSKIGSYYSGISSNGSKRLIAIGGDGHTIYESSPNSELSGRIAYARMAKKLFSITGTTSYQTTYNNTISTINNRLPSINPSISNDVEQNQICGWDATADCGRDNVANLGQFDFLTPELGRWIKDNYITQSTSILSTVEGKFKFWYMGSYNIAPQGAGAEGYYQSPLLSYQMFQAKAQILGTPVSTLRSQLPWVTEFTLIPANWDVLNYANLTTLIRQSEAVNWTDTNTGPTVATINNLPSPNPSPIQTPSPTSVPTPIPTPLPTPSPLKVGDFDGNGKIDIFDYNTLLTNFNKSGAGVVGDITGPQGTPDGIVSIYDYNLLLTNFGK